MSTVEKKWNMVPVYIILAISVIMALYPIYWMLNTSIKTSKEIYSFAPTFWPSAFTLSSYKELFFQTNYLINLWNSLYVSISSTFLSIGVSILTAYAIARLRFRGKLYISRIILYAYLIPRSVLYIPLYLFVANVGLLDTKAGLVLTYPTFIIPYATWMLIAYFRTLPASLEDAAIVDGCTYFQTLGKIILPIAMPGLVSVFIFSFTMSWGEYLYALVIVTSNLTKTLPIGLSELIIDDFFNWGPLMAGAIIASIPVITLYMISSRFLVTGMTSGSVKQ